MSINVSKKRLKKPLRFIKLIEGMREGKTFGVIAEECNVSLKTIERDFWEWKNNGGFDKWLATEFMLLHDAETQKEGRSDAYRVIADLLKKRLKEQSEVAITGAPRLVVEVVDNTTENTVSASSSADSNSQ